MTPDETPDPAERPQEERDAVEHRVVVDAAAERAVRVWRALLERLRHT